jgi:hypothetical protein
MPHGMKRQIPGIPGRFADFYGIHNPLKAPLDGNGGHRFLPVGIGKHKIAWLRSIGIGLLKFQKEIKDSPENRDAPKRTGLGLYQAIIIGVIFSDNENVALKVDMLPSQGSDFPAP